MSSYADAAARGPKQTAEEARAPAPPQLEQTESVESSSLIDVDSESVNTVPNDFNSQEIQTETQRDRIEREVADADARAAARSEEKARGKKSAAKKGASKVKANSDNPVVVANLVASIGLGGFLGFGAYRKYVAGELTWKAVGVYAGVVGLFGIGDYFVSQALFKRFPTKK